MLNVDNMYIIVHKYSQLLWLSSLHVQLKPIIPHTRIILNIIVHILIFEKPLLDVFHGDCLTNASQKALTEDILV